MVEKVLTMEEIEQLSPNQRQKYREKLKADIAWKKSNPQLEITTDPNLKKFEKLRSGFEKSEGIEALGIANTPYEKLVEKLASGEIRYKKDRKRLRGE